MIVMLPLLGCQAFEPAKSQASNENHSQPGQAGPSSTQPGKPLKLFPVDQASEDPSFEGFRRRLTKANEEHDLPFILSILDPGIRNTSDGNAGIDEFKENWKVSQADSALWETLGMILSMGGSFRVNDGRREFCAPYITSEWKTVASRLPEGSDPLDYQVITGDAVILRSEPTTTSPELARLSYDVVRIHTSGSENRNSGLEAFDWTKVTTLTGQQGYVPLRSVRGPSDYHACFTKIGGKWLMVELAATD